MSDLSSGAGGSEFPDGKAPIVASFSAAWSFARDFGPRLLPAGALATLGYAYYQSKVYEWAGQPNFGEFVMVAFVYMIAWVVANCAFLRASVRGEVAPSAALSFGLDELRLIGVIVALSLAVGIVAFFFVFVLIIMFVGMAANSGIDFEAIADDPLAMQEAFVAIMGSGGGLLIGLIALAGAILLLWFQLRMTLFMPATIGERRMMIFQTWSWTKGNVWRIFAALMITIVPPVFGLGIIAGLIQQIVIGDAPMAASSTARFLGLLPMGAVNAFGMLMSAGLVGYLYHGLRPRNWAADD